MKKRKRKRKRKRKMIDFMGESVMGRTIEVEDDTKLINALNIILQRNHRLPY